MGYIYLDDGSKIDKNFFEARLKELKEEKWFIKEISELGMDHVHCELTFETISAKNYDQFYESDKGSIVSVKAYEKYLK